MVEVWAFGPDDAEPEPRLESATKMVVTSASSVPTASS
jgi:hypothetical protein